MNVGKYKWVMLGAIVVVIAMLGYGAMTMKDQRTGAERISDAINALPEGADKAEQQLEERTPGQKIGDSVKDMGDKIKDNTRSSDSE